MREIFSADPDTFERHAGPFLGPLVGDHSLLLLHGAAHKRERSLLVPPFHGARMKTYGHLIQDAALRCAAAWSPGRSFLIQETTQAISLEVIIRAVFGIQHEERGRLLMGIIPAYFQAFTSLLVYFPPLRREFGGLGPWSRFKKLAARFDQLIFEEIGSRRREPGDRADILSLLLSARYEDGSEMSDPELCDELKTLLLASHETTAIALAWAFYWVHRQPEVYRCLGEELKGLGRLPQPDDLAQLPYLSAVCDEALRLYPVVAATMRKLRRPFHLRGYELPAGVAVGAAMALAHVDPTPDPMRFRPERLLERKYTPYEYLPFGGGARRCLGAAFATYEMKIVLGSILAHLEALRLGATCRPLSDPGSDDTHHVFPDLPLGSAAPFQKAKGVIAAFDNVQRGAILQAGERLLQLREIAQRIARALDEQHRASDSLQMRCSKPRPAGCKG